jgi:hypothetical protein
MIAVTKATYPVPMTWEEIRDAHVVGLGRCIANRNSRDKAQYSDRKRMTADRVAQPGAVLCEMAVAKFLEIPFMPTLWPSSEHHKHKNDADIGSLIEVRRVRFPGLGPSVTHKERGRVLVGVYLPDKPEDEWFKAEVVGWARPAWDATEKDFNRLYIVKHTDGGKPYWRVPVELLEEPSEENRIALREEFLSDQRKHSHN